MNDASDKNKMESIGFFIMLIILTFIMSGCGLLSQLTTENPGTASAGHGKAVSINWNLFIEVIGAYIAAHWSNKGIIAVIVKILKSCKGVK